MILNSSIDSRLGVDSSVMFEPTSTFETPSTSQLTALRRAPFIEMLTVLVRPMPTSSVRSLDTPGASVASCTKLRLLSGSSCTWVDVIVDCSAGDRLHQRLSGRDLDALGHAADRQVPVQLQPIVDVQIDILERDRLKAGQLEGDLVGANRQQRQGVRAGAGRHDLKGPSGTHVFGNDRRARKRGPGFVGDDAGNGSGRFLRRPGRRRNERKHHREDGNTAPKAGSHE